MTTPIERFLERVRSAESRNQRELVMNLAEARDLHADVTRLLLRLEKAHTDTANNIQIELHGKDF